MSCQKFLKFFNIMCNYGHRQILPQFAYSSIYNNPSFKNLCKGNPLFPLASNFTTSATHRCNDENLYIDEKELYFMESGRRLVTHKEDPNMPKVKIILIDKEGKELEVEAHVGMIVLRAALKYKAPIEAACEGKKACTTCHCYVALEDQDYFTPSDLDEEDLLDMAVFCKPTSRLACQLKIIKPFDCVRIHLPFATVNFAVDKDSKKKEENVIQ